MIDLARVAPSINIAELSPRGGLLLVIPHPDDETLGCGAALAEAADSGRNIVLALVTDGEASHPKSLSYHCENLRKLRRSELESALNVLSPDKNVQVETLSLPDGRSNASHLPDRGFEDLLALTRQNDVRSIWTTWRQDPHCDHQTAAAIAARLARRTGARLWEFPVWGRFNDPLDPAPALRRFAPSEPFSVPRKQDAIRSYRSQLTPLIDDDPSAFMMPPALVEHFASHPELFIRG